MIYNTPPFLKIRKRPSEKMSPHVYFVTGTDTGVGKTFCTAAMLHAATQAGKQTIGFKPIASEADHNGQNADVLLLQAASRIRLPYNAHNCYTFGEATAPHLAAADAGIEMQTQWLSQKLADLKRQGNWILVEGAGGWLTPLGNGADFSDWVVMEKMPVILVVGMKLGCINHAMLTVHAVNRAGLPVAGWVANCISATPHRLDNYLATLKCRIPAPLLGVVPYSPTDCPENISRHFSIECLL